MTLSVLQSGIVGAESFYFVCFLKFWEVENYFGGER